MTQRKPGSLVHAVDGRLVIILLLGCISFTTVTISPPWDLWDYMARALSLLNGHGYVYTDGRPVLHRGPVFPLLLALSFKMGGPTPESAFYVVRFFCVGTPVLVYLFGKRLFNSQVGFASALFILSSYSLSYWSYRHLDIVWPFFVILHCYLLLEGFERKKLYWFVLAGLALGVAYLTKEVALLFFPLGPLMFLWVKEYRTATNLKYILIALVTLVITILPWALYLWQHDSLHFLWGSGGPRVLRDMGVSQQAGGDFTGKILRGVEQYRVAFISFYSGDSRNTVAANFTIAPLFLFAWLYIVLRAMAGDKRSKILVLNLFLFLPIIYFIGENHWRFGQVLHTMLISYLALSFTLFSCVEWICNGLRWAGASSKVFIFISVVVISTQIFSSSEADKGYVSFFKCSLLYNFFSGKNTETVADDRYSSEYLDDIIGKLVEVSDDDDGVLVKSPITGRILLMKTGGRQHVYNLPRLIYDEKGLVGVPKKSYLSGKRASIIWAVFNSSGSKFNIYMMFEDELKRLLKKNKIKYVLLSPDFPESNKYFSSSGNFEMIFQAGPTQRSYEQFYLYKLNPVFLEEKQDVTYMENRRFYYSGSLVQGLYKLKEKYPEKYLYVRDTILYGAASLDEDDLREILNAASRFPAYHKDLGKKALHAGNFLLAKKAFRKVVRLAPDDANSRCVLADLYSRNGQFVEAEEEYELSLSLQPGNILCRISFGDMYRKKGNKQAALEQYRLAVGLRPETGQAFRSLGNAFRELGELNDARDSYVEAIRLDRKDVSAHILLGDLYHEEGKVKAASQQYKKAWRLQPENAKLARILGDLYRQIGEYEDSLAMYKAALSLRPDMAYYHSLVSMAYQDLGESDKALRYAEEAVRLNPTRPAYKNLLLKLNKEINTGR